MNINNFTKRMTELMESKNLTIYDISESTGLAPSTISIYISGKMMPRPAVISKLAEYFGVTPKHLMASENEDEQDTNVSLLLKQLIYNTKKDYITWSQTSEAHSSIEEYESFYNTYIYKIKKQNNSFSLYIFDEKYDEVFKKRIFNDIELKTLNDLFEVITLNILTEDDKTILQILDALKKTPDEINASNEEDQSEY